VCDNIGSWVAGSCFEVYALLMHIRGTDFVLYTVTDYERAKAFYRDILGLQPAQCWDDLFWAEFEIPPTTLAIHDPARNGEYVKEYPSGTVFLAVEDIFLAVEEFRNRGVEIVYGPVETPICFDAAIKDPDGNIIGLHQRKDGTYG